MAIKKVFTDIIALLEENADKKVKSILPQIMELASAKTNRAEGSTFLKDASGNVVAIFDYYFKRWMPLVGEKKVDFGQKVKTATGFNSMSKEGVSNWTKQQRVAKAEGMSLLDKVAKGEIQPQDIAKHQEAIETARNAIVPTELGFATVEELNEYLTANGVTLASAE